MMWSRIISWHSAPVTSFRATLPRRPCSSTNVVTMVRIMASRDRFTRSSSPGTAAVST